MASTTSTTTVPQDDVSAMLSVAIAAAKRAGAHMKTHLSSARVEKTKSNKDDLVTVVDKQCQDLVFQTIQESFPTHEFLGEENVEPGSEASAQALLELVSKEWLWIVDPIDGTTNFVHKRPASVVSVACAHKGEVVVGVIYDPYRDEIFTAQEGHGAFCNGTPVHVSAEATFSEALIGFGIGTKDSVRLPMLDCVREFSAKCRGLRLQGAAALELSWTCCGRQTVRLHSFVCCVCGLLASIITYRKCARMLNVCCAMCMMMCVLAGLLRAGPELVGRRGGRSAREGSRRRGVRQRGQAVLAEHAPYRGLERRRRHPQDADRAHRQGRRRPGAQGVSCSSRRASEHSQFTAATVR